MNCLWCKENIDQSDPAYQALKMNLGEIPICDPTFIEVQVMEGKMCRRCYETNVNWWLYTQDAHPPYCLMCRAPVFFDEIGLTEEKIEKQKKQREKDPFILPLSHERALLTRKEISTQRMQIKQGDKPNDYQKAMANELLCLSCFNRAMEEINRPAANIVEKDYSPTWADYADTAQAREGRTHHGRR